MSELKLDRMALDDVGVNPKRLAEAIHGQMGEGSGPVPIYEIAGLKETFTGEGRECLGRFNEALEKYYARDWAAAKAGFTSVEFLCHPSHVGDADSGFHAADAPRDAEDS